MTLPHPDKTNVKTGWIPLLTKRLTQLSPKVSALLGILAGAIGVTGFSPFYFWPGYFVCLVIFSALIMTSPSAKSARWRGASVALGFFGAGISWVYVSIAEYGQVGSLIAALITLMFVSVLCVFWVLAAWSSWRLMQRFSRWPASLWISLCFLTAEYLRSTLFTGFPWLLPGYAIENTWLFELLPVGGVWLTSAVVVVTASALASLLVTKKRSVTLLSMALIAWLIAAWLAYVPVTWVKQTGTLSTTLIQGNVKQDEKWLAHTAGQSLAYYQQTTMAHLNSELVVWPETAITYPYPQIQPYLTSFSQELANSNTTLITGIPDINENSKEYYNAIWATGNGFGLYYKRRLVPFGEYLPLNQYIGPILDVFDMPMSNFTSGDDNQPVLQVGEWGIAPFICYEIVYAEQVRRRVRDSDFLITISNDGWFGRSIGPWQHLQIAQFRAKESGRYVIRATNTGITAFINEQGRIVAQAPQFERTTLTADAKAFAGITPYVQWGYWPTIWWLGLCVMLSFMGLLLSQRKKIV
ncbi:apolipoprotein N-acyltransferase [Marinomonas sp. IMCC 4694]|uniref:apolipoprotein N-acyltransferase n=1 Tax=Marinomonas sp. IMCC 4694 TaxID=2605432 RepID=UPI0011E7C915|nr:apolipoprotein N-acyltransferase [Marinomonas sp. IMCC 4694]TYL48248.1 apolipoprotein N-acyltransferase [Marinomonas sp. IMCC 4694]